MTRVWFTTCTARRTNTVFALHTWTSWTVHIHSEITESLLDRLINTSNQILMDGASHRPLKRPGATAPLDNTKPAR